MMKNYRLQKTLDGSLNRNTPERRMYLMSFEAYVIPKWVYACASIILVLTGFYIQEYAAYIWFVAAYCYMQVVKREARRDGFMDGHKSGYEDCWNDQRGITDEEAADFEQMELESSIPDEVNF